ncbi:hypothetical protein VAPA_1c06110 [Variovorax paradoxus B4]|uniref:DUF3540 domain-containing protein n=1 Tax=Variovorax paradoxus B4 TaxID=1246301 RepID=T1X5L9_VARPD|nr:DUF3540 domain-containing protein [Variovorax paradoxus]AGU47741.1 hypothetical protein VAPA_1c06110 [Variovorax paradoxus B4]
MNSTMPPPRSSTATATATARSRKRRAAPPIGGTWCVGILAFDAEGRPRVNSGGQQLRATRAASCLLEPAAGDSVACLCIAPDEVWITAVLQREEGTPNVLRCGDGLRIAVDGGSLELDAKRVGVSSDALDVSTRQVTVSTETAEVVGRELSFIGTRIRIVGAMLSSVMDRVQHFSKSYLRTTEGIDRVSATHVECEAAQLMRIEGEHTLVNGRELVKARGAQIHFG